LKGVNPHAWHPFGEKVKKKTWNATWLEELFEGSRGNSRQTEGRDRKGFGGWWYPAGGPEALKSKKQERGWHAGRTPKMGQARL